MGIFRNLQRCEKKTRRNSRQNHRPLVGSLRWGGIELTPQGGRHFRLTTLARFRTRLFLYGLASQTTTFLASAARENHEHLRSLERPSTASAKNRSMPNTGKCSRSSTICMRPERRQGIRRTCGTPGPDGPLHHEPFQARRADDAGVRLSRFRQSQGPTRSDAATHGRPPRKRHLVTGRDLLSFLKEWWINHIQAEDKCYVPYLSAAARQRTRYPPLRLNRSAQ